MLQKSWQAKSDDLQEECLTFRFSSGDKPSAGTGCYLTVFSCRLVRSLRKRLSYDQAMSKRSRFITLVHAATKSCTNFFCASALP